MTEERRLKVPQGRRNEPSILQFPGSSEGKRPAGTPQAARSRDRVRSACSGRARETPADHAALGAHTPPPGSDGDGSVEPFLTPGPSRPARPGHRPCPAAASARYGRTHGRGPAGGRGGDRDNQVKAPVINYSFLAETKRLSERCVPRGCRGRRRSPRVALARFPSAGTVGGPRKEPSCAGTVPAAFASRASARLS